MNARKGPGADTGNAGHFAKTTASESAISLDTPSEQLDHLTATIENTLRYDLIIADGGGHPEERWPMDSGDFSPAGEVISSDFAEALLKNPGWETDLEAFTKAFPKDMLYCTRDESAWSYGTMGPDDFMYVSEDPELVAEIQADLAAALSAPQPEGK